MHHEYDEIFILRTTIGGVFVVLKKTVAARL